jgi:lysophospholipase L1-like esterase
MNPLDSRMLRTCGAALLLWLAACGGKSPGPPPTPIADPPQISCPADVAVPGITGSAQTVDYTAPTVTGGTAPVNTSCTPASGTSFPLGTTAVSCMASDAGGRQATCSFNVALSGLTIAATLYEAVGDSLTAGENGAGLKPAFVDPPNSYPTKLEALLEATFPGQGIKVLNRGVSGQKVEQTVEQLPNNLLRDRPQAVLILIGYNDLEVCGPGQADSTACGIATDRVAIGVRDCIRRSKESPVGIKYIFASTLTPPGTGSKRIAGEAIIETNNKIRQMVAIEKGTLVDTYPMFLGHEAEYVSGDGLHLNPAGYQAIAEAFFASIKATVPQTTPGSLVFSR